MLSSGVLDSWRSLSEVFKGEAIFSYMTQNSVADVVEYFSIDVDKDVPIIAAHQPSTDSKYKSKRLDLTKLEAMQDFVAGVITEKVARVMKSEPIPKKSTRPVIVAVGSSVVDLVSQEEKDVLLVVYTPWCQNCRGLLPTYDILGRAVQGEERIIVAKIDATANDIPISWKVKSDPTILWFPAKDKPYKNDVPVARNYWDAGFSLIELVGFIQREGSFDSSTLKIATMEQLSFLQTDEDAAREKYILEELQFKRNEGRKIYDNQLLDFFDGEIVFDGKRWHLLVALIVSVWCIGSTVFGLTTLAGLKSPTSRKKNK